ncbi:MAG TPA: ABC transporter substrate-binding protein [Clostridiales bacterium]|nr:ABC transporter substrate-binding protein [Clostridiales bacterium]
MRKGSFLYILCATLSILVLMTVSACNGNSDSSGAGGKIKVVFGDPGWDSVKIHDAVAMFIGEAAYDIDAEEVSGSTAVTYSGLKSGDIDVYMETWSNNIATYDEDVEDGIIKELSVNYDDNAQGLYVPSYVIEGDSSRGIKASAPDLKTVADLKKYSSVFKDPDDPGKGRIYGAMSGWEVDEVMRAKYEYYGLDSNYNYVDPGSDSALAAAIASAYEKGEAIVAYYWTPTWITGKYDLVLLGDNPYDAADYEKGACACPSVRVTVCANSAFYEEAPEFCEFLSKYQTSSDLTAEALAYINDNDASYEDAAKWFLHQHDDLLDQWLPGDKAQLVREALAE